MKFTYIVQMINDKTNHVYQEKGEMNHRQLSSLFNWIHKVKNELGVFNGTTFKVIHLVEGAEQNKIVDSIDVFKI